VSASDAAGPSVVGVDEPLSAETLRQQAQTYAALAETESDRNSATFVLFRLGGERFAIALDDLDEVACVETCIAVANVDPTILGREAGTRASVAAARSVELKTKIDAEKTALRAIGTGIGKLAGGLSADAWRDIGLESDHLMETSTDAQ
jgi:hypothetical protein